MECQLMEGIFNELIKVEMNKIKYKESFISQCQKVMNNFNFYEINWFKKEFNFLPNT